ncbi:MAG: hypothetical protein KGL39_31065 [Patescibacteria group bacterium]|nr:hypothetical protein [Patescibacteria group bacterium]
MKQYTPEEELQRGLEAKTILESPVFIEACQAVDTQLKTLRERVPVSDTDMMVRLVLMEQISTWLLDYMKQCMQSGEFARHQLEKRDSAVERMKQAMQHGLRNLNIW